MRRSAPGRSRSPPTTTALAERRAPNVAVLISPVRVQGILKSIPKYYPDFTARDFEGIQPWRGLRPCSPDGLPYVGRTARYTNLAIATGHAMMGLSLGPITGKLMAEILSGEKPSIKIQLLDPDRYA